MLLSLFCCKILCHVTITVINVFREVSSISVHKELSLVNGCHFIAYNLFSLLNKLIPKLYKLKSSTSLLCNITADIYIKRKEKNINFEFIFKLNLLFCVWWKHRTNIIFLSWCKTFSLSWASPKKLILSQFKPLALFI